MRRCPVKLGAFAVFILALAATSPAAEVLSEAATKAMIISAPRPKYPAKASGLRLSGMGIVLMKVDFDTGRVTDVVVTSSTGHAILDNAALKVPSAAGGSSRAPWTQ